MKPTERDLRIAQILVIESGQPETQADIYRLASIEVKHKLADENESLRRRMWEAQNDVRTLEAQVRGLQKRQQWLEQYRP